MSEVDNLMPRIVVDISFQNYKRSLQSGIRQSTITLDLPNSQIKSILSVATDTTPFTNPNDVNPHLIKYIQPLRTEFVCTTLVGDEGAL